MNKEPPIQQPRPRLPTIYIVCTVPGREEVQIVHSQRLAAAIVALSHEGGRAPKRIVDREEYERVRALLGR